MTVDEVTVKISVAADEALTALDGLGDKLQAVGTALAGKREIKLDTLQAQQSVERLKAALNSLNETPADGGLSAAMGQMLADFEAACQTSVVSDALAAVRDAYQTAITGVTPDGDQIDAFVKGWERLTGEGSPLCALAEQLGELSGQGVETFLPRLVEMAAGAEGLGDALGSLSPSVELTAERLGALAGECAAGADGLKDWQEETDALAKSASQLEKKVGAVAGVQKNIAAYQSARKAYDEAKKSGKDVEKAFDGCQSAAKKLSVQVDRGTGSVKDMDKAMGKADGEVSALEKGIQESGGTIVSTLQGMLSQAVQTESALNVQAAMGVDVSQPLSAIRTVITVINALLSLMGRAGIKGNGSGGGGGGGGGKKQAADDDDGDKAAREAEAARKEAIQRDYDYIDHKRHMNEITLEEELALLEKIRSAHQLNAEEIMEWEEKIYDLKKEIRERDAQSIDTLTDGVVTALEKRYEAMRDAELDRLDSSREAWEQWRDSSVQAIEDQISALDKLSDTEDREAKDAAELRKIEKLRREIEYEQDDYNKAKLEQQLAAALTNREERLRKLALSDQKDALRAEIETVNAKADEQIDALDKEQAGIEAAYAERLKAAALNAEAEKLVMTQSQDELMSLLYNYVPEYDALGKTMGEKLVEGFQSKVGDIVGWFESFNAGLAGMQEQLAAASNAAANGFYQSYADRQSAAASGVTVNQNVTFNEPVESPSQVARRMADVNDALGELLG